MFSLKERQAGGAGIQHALGGHVAHWCYLAHHFNIHKRSTTMNFINFIEINLKEKEATFDFLKWKRLLRVVVMLVVALLLASLQHCFGRPSLMSHTQGIVYTLPALKHPRIIFIYYILLKDHSSFVGTESANKCP